jgi:hypothetical protein
MISLLLVPLFKFKLFFVLFHDPNHLIRISTNNCCDSDAFTSPGLSNLLPPAASLPPVTLKGINLKVGITAFWHHRRKGIAFK